MRQPPRALLTLWGVACFLATSTASAYCRTYTCDNTKTECERDDESCIVSGKPLFWSSSCVGFTAQAEGSPRHGISGKRFEGLIERAFDRWLAADCGNGITPLVSVQNMGPVRCSRAEYNQDQGNANIFMFRDEEWPENVSSRALALTTLWFNPQSGEIYDADIEINSTAPPGTVTDGVDLESVLTHEIGHFLGLSHSPKQTAVMRTFYDPGRDDLRVLDTDDIAGICSIFTPDRSVGSTSCEPRHGFSSTCRKKPDGCSIAGAPGGARELSGWPWLAALLLGVGLRARRRSLPAVNADRPLVG